MSQKLYTAIMAVLVLAIIACSDNVAGSSEDPNTVTAKNNQSSNSDVEISSSAIIESSSSIKTLSSSSGKVVLCKVSGDWGDVGCAPGPDFSDGDLWSRNDRIVKTKTFADDSTKFGEHAGEIFVETDSIEGSVTRIFLSPDSSSKYNGYLSGLYQFDPDSMTENSYFNIGFYVAGFDSNGTMLSADISNWGGICVMYRGQIDPVIQLDLGDSLNKKLGYALPSVTVVPTREDPGYSLIRGRTNEILCYEWNQFKQPDIKGKHEIISGEDAAKNVAKVIFHFQAQPGSDYGYFSFLAFGTSRDQEERSTPSDVDPCKGKGGKNCVVPGHGDLWSVGDYQVNTKAYSYRPSQFEDDAGTFFFDDGYQNGAKTEVEWYESGWLSNLDSSFHHSYDFVLGYRSGEVSLTKGDMDRNAFFDIGFYVAGFDSNGTMLSADISNWNGICIVINYILDDKMKKPSMQLDLGDSINKKVNNVLPEVTLESEENTQCFEWTQFKQPGADNISGEDAAKNVARIIIHFESTLETSLFAYDIRAIGTNRDE